MQLHAAIKRVFDVTATAAGLVLLSPLFLICAVVVKLDSPGPVFFRQRRVGRGFRPFEIFKFRSMIDGAAKRGLAITAADDDRITSVGRFLRKSKLDELPQLVNVLRGDMSLVGPRAEAPKYVEMFKADFEEILQVRPGITDYASIRYHNEAAVLGSAENAEKMYVEKVLPEKIALAKDYVARQFTFGAFLLDLRLIVKTLAILISPGRLRPRRPGLSR